MLMQNYIISVGEGPSIYSLNLSICQNSKYVRLIKNIYLELLLVCVSLSNYIISRQHEVGYSILHTYTKLYTISLYITSCAIMYADITILHFSASNWCIFLRLEITT